MRVEGSKQGRYRDIKLEQLGEEKYIELERRARGTYPRKDAIRDYMILVKEYGEAT